MFNCNKLQILIYHRVLNEPDPMRPGEMDVSLFETQMKILRQHFNPLGLSEGLYRLKSGTLPKRAVAITFDDGYKDNLSHAWPILKRYDLKPTIFVATGFLNSGIMWNDAIIELVRRSQDVLDLTKDRLGCMPVGTLSEKLTTARYLIQSLKYCHPDLRNEVIDKVKSTIGLSIPADLMMTVTDIQQLALEGVEIGAHTVTHPILSKIPFEVAETEIMESKLFLEGILGQSIKYFAYPNGNPGVDYHLSHRNFLKTAGFEAGFSTWWAAANRQMDFYQLPRFTPWDTSRVKFRLRMLQYRFKSVGRALKIR
ncbi:MAG: polysaccharide deacetylase family protein [Gammaproteobacteria bacterium]